MFRLARLLMLLSCLSLAAGAHTFWLRALPEGAELLLGHDETSDAYTRSSLSELKAYDGQGQPIQFEERISSGLLALHNPQALAYSVKADYGIWIKTIHGWRPGSKQDSQDRVLKSMWSIFYCKLVRGSGVSLKLNLPIEIIVLSHQGEQLEAQLLWQGQPRPDCPVFHEHEQVARTDSSGRFVTTWKSGTSLNLSASVEEQLPNNVDADVKATVGSVTFAP
ncbi:hypothetical protein JST97_12155 [bacterium]|nr:hypothetical protein [bacterium]